MIRWTSIRVLALVVAVLGATAASPTKALAATTAAVTDDAVSCVRPVVPTTILATTTKTLVKAGSDVVAKLPSSVPVDAKAVVIQTTMSKPSANSDLKVAPASQPGQAQAVAYALRAKIATTTSWIPNPGSDLRISLSTGKTAATVQVVGFVPNNQCYRSMAPAPLVDTLTGVGAPKAPVPAGGSLDLDLAPLGALDDTKTAPIGLRVAAGKTASVVKLIDADGGGQVIAERAVAINTAVVGMELLPPNGTGKYRLAVSGGPADITVLGLGAFTVPTAFVPGSTLLLNTSLPPAKANKGLAAKKPVTVPLPPEAATASAVAVRVDSFGPTKSPTVFLWPKGGTKPAVASAMFGAKPESEIIIVSPGANNALTLEVGAGSSHFLVTFVGRAPVPPPVNQPVPGMMHAPAESQVDSVIADPTADTVSIEYSGADKLNKGEFVVVPPSDGAPDGFLGSVSSVKPAAAQATALEDRHPAAIHTLAEPTQPLSVELERAVLTEVIPTADFTKDIAVASEEADPLAESAPLPPDVPPGVDDPPPTPAPDEVHVLSEPVEEEGGFTTSEKTSGKLPGGFKFKCESNRDLDVTASLNLQAGVNFTGQWRPFKAPIVEVSVDGSVSGALEATASAWVKCNASKHLQGPTLPRLNFVVAGVPVWITPILSMSINAKGSIDGSVTAKASASVSARAGVRYDGNFTPFISNSATLNTSVEARANLSAEIAALPRLDLKVYGAVGPYAIFGPYAKFNATVGANPWWTAQVGMRAGVGLNLDLWILKKSYDGPRWDFPIRTINGGAWPGPSLSASTSANATVGAAYSRQLSASGGTGPYKWYAVSGSLPGGVSLAQSGLISGTPNAAGTYNLVVRAIDARGNRAGNDQTVTITVGTPPPPPPSGGGGGGGGATVSLSKGNSAQGQAGCSSSACRFMNVQLSGFAPNRSVRIECWSTVDSGAFYAYNRTTDGNGNNSSAVCYFGFPGKTAWIVADGVRSNNVVW